MEPLKVKTTFAPRSPQDSARGVRKHHDYFMTVAVAAFVITLVVWGSVWGYKLFLEREVRTLELELQKVRGTLDNAIIFDLRQVDSQLKLGKEVLSGHADLLPVFRLLGAVILRDSVKLSTFSYQRQGDTGVAHAVNTSGTARSFSSLAFQKQQLVEHEDILNPVFSGISVNAETGFVNFSLAFSVHPRVLLPTGDADAGSTEAGGGETEGGGAS
jgi:hypothetical protein